MVETLKLSVSTCFYRIFADQYKLSDGRQYPITKGNKKIQKADHDP